MAAPFFTTPFQPYVYQIPQDAVIPFQILGGEAQVLQLVRSNNRRFMTSQVDEEAHQLSYLQKHMGNMISLLAELADGEGDESLALTLERFEHLGLLIQFGYKGSEGTPLSHLTPFLANSDPDMPPSPVPASQILDWILQNIAVFGSSF